VKDGTVLMVEINADVFVYKVKCKWYNFVLRSDRQQMDIIVLNQALLLQQITKICTLNNNHST